MTQTKLDTPLAEAQDRPPDLPRVQALDAAEPPAARCRKARLPAEDWRALHAFAGRTELLPTSLLVSAFADAIGYFSARPQFALGVGTGLEIQIDAHRGSHLTRAHAVQRRLLAARAEGAEHAGLVSRPSRAVVFSSALDAPSLSAQALLSELVWLHCHADERGGELELTWHSRDGLFPGELAADLFETYRRLLTRLARHPEQWREPCCVELPERQQRLRAEVNRTDAELPKERLQDAFTRYARRNPEAPAVITSRRTLSYGELDRLSNRLARRLRSNGVTPDSLVAILAEKSWEQVVAVYGVLKAGAAYVPLDPSWPAERLSRVLETTRSHSVVTQAGLEERLHRTRAIHVLNVTDAEQWTGDEPIEPAQEPEHLAYVLFTSGSTGDPKGVALEHRGPLNTITAMNRHFALDEHDRVLALSALTFDLSVYDLFGPLAVGAAIVLPDPEGTRDPSHWYAQIQAHGVTLWNSVPALLDRFVAHLTERDVTVSSLRNVILSGDWIPTHLPERLRSVCTGPVRVFASGGPTETSIWSILYPVNEIDPTWKSIPYGKPLQNQRVHVLDARMLPAPEWVPGRMYVAGVCLARGYFGDEALTAERFVVNPATGERLYFTGDLGRYLPDGNIEFLGREDFQVKIHGNRIELGEIEAALGAHPRVEAAVALVGHGRHEHVRLLACYVTTGGEAVSSDDLRAHAAKTLPEYMLPSVLLWVPELPLTANGKVDRAALFRIVSEHAEPEAPYRAPRNEAELRMAAVWADVLRVPRVGVDDDFARLGGDSLLAILLVQRARAAGFTIDQRQLIQSRSLADLVEHCTRPARQPEREQAGAACTGDQPLTPLQRWYLDAAASRLEPQRWNASLLFELEPFDVELFRQALLHVVNHHAALRARFRADASGRWTQEIDPARNEAPFRIVDLSGIPPVDRAAALERECDALQGSYRFEHGHLLQVVFFRFDRQGHGRVWFNAHHLLVDAVSVVVLLEDMALAYRQLANGATPDLGPRTACVGRFAAELERWVNERLLPREREYWLELPWQEIPHLPIDYADRDGLAATARSMTDIWDRLSPDESELVLRRAPATLGVSSENLLIAALLQSVTRWTGGQYQDILALHSGRQLDPELDATDVSRTVGWLNSERALVLRRSDATHPLIALKEIQRRIESVPNAGHGYHLLCSLARDRELARSLTKLRKRPGILFNYQRYPDLPNGLRLATEATGRNEHPDNPSFNALECQVLAVGEQVSLRFRYSTALHTESTVRSLLQQTRAFLRDVVEASA